jgi:hypothetical protein
MVAGLTAQTSKSASTGSAKATPRTADGHPDLSGSWDRGSAGSGAVSQLAANADGKSVCIFACADQSKPVLNIGGGGGAAPAPERPKYKPEFQAKVKDLNARQIFEDPAFRCLPPGVPRIGPPARIFQTPREVVFLYDDLSGNFFRVIPIDGRSYRTDVEASYLGDAVGHWEGDTLVVETRNFNEDSWLIDDGSFHTRNLRVVERLRRDGNTIEYQATAIDPEVLAEPWVMKPRKLTPSNHEVAEAAPCIERDANRIPDLSSHDNRR